MSSEKFVTEIVTGSHGPKIVGYTCKEDRNDPITSTTRIAVCRDGSTYKIVRQYYGGNKEGWFDYYTMQVPDFEYSLMLQCVQLLKEKEEKDKNE